jgi:RNA recognition motif-containing protein
VEFVCEADVRDAIREQRKIPIGPKTIVTPSARDLAGPNDILVLV